MTHPPLLSLQLFLPSAPLSALEDPVSSTPLLISYQVNWVARYSWGSRERL